MSDRDPYQELLDESRHREVLEERARERSLDAQLREDATLAGTLTDLAEQGAGVTLRTGSGTTHQGRLVAVAGDHVVVQRLDGQRTYVALVAVGDVRPEPVVGHDGAAGDRSPPGGRTLREVLARAAEQRRRVQLRLHGQPDGVTGQLRSVGADVASVRLDGGAGTAYVSVAAVTEVSVVD